MESIDRARKDHGDFLHEASENHCLTSRGHSYTPEYSASAPLDDAYIKLIHAIAIIERAEPIEYDTLTDAEARRELTCDIAAALPADVSRVSDGRVLCDEASEADLTPFEQLISCLGIHEGARPSATAAWVRKALKGRNRG